MVEHAYRGDTQTAFKDEKCAAAGNCRQRSLSKLIKVVQIMNCRVRIQMQAVCISPLDFNLKIFLKMYIMQNFL